MDDNRCPLCGAAHVVACSNVGCPMVEHPARKIANDVVLSSLLLAVLWLASAIGLHVTSHHDNYANDVKWDSRYCHCELFVGGVCAQ